MIASWRTNRLSRHIFILTSQMQSLWMVGSWGECQRCPPQLISPVSSVGSRWLDWMDHQWGGPGHFIDYCESTQECPGGFYCILELGALQFTRDCHQAWPHVFTPTLESINQSKNNYTFSTPVQFFSPLKALSRWDKRPLLNFWRHIGDCLPSLKA